MARLTTSRKSIRNARFMRVECGRGSDKTRYERVERKCTCKTDKLGAFPTFDYSNGAWRGNPCSSCIRGMLAYTVTLPIGARATYRAWTRPVVSLNPELTPIMARVFAPDTGNAVAVRHTPLSVPHNGGKSDRVKRNANTKVKSDSNNGKRGSNATRLRGGKISSCSEPVMLKTVSRPFIQGAIEAKLTSLIMSECFPVIRATLGNSVNRDK